MDDRPTHSVHGKRAIDIIRGNFGVHLERRLISRSLSEAIDHFGCSRTHCDIVFG
ncbi:hypothetical protein [Sphingomonas sp. PAMC 26621]|uniref:hypothetical protein n=1 Tax=Sphingomonas sp. PAMC 26621 TaxID=1112213 RepID=UPI00031C5EB5|nr:hypothetical protein [Sphingomonas sp. PAMC 26621]